MPSATTPYRSITLQFLLCISSSSFFTISGHTALVWNNDIWIDRTYRWILQHWRPACHLLPDYIIVILINHQKTNYIRDSAKVNVVISRLLSDNHRFTIDWTRIVFLGNFTITFLFYFDVEYISSSLSEVTYGVSMKQTRFLGANSSHQHYVNSRRPCIVWRNCQRRRLVKSIL